MASESLMLEVILLSMISGKWKVLLSIPGFTSSVIFAFISTLPRADSTQTISPLLIKCFWASSALINNRSSVLINAEDAQKHLINNGDMVCVESARGKVDIKAKITDEVKPGILSSTFHFPENMLNNITSSISDSEAMCPEYKVVACNIRKSKGKYKEV